MTCRDTPDDDRHDRPPPTAVRIPACTPEAFAGLGACAQNSPSHPPAHLPQGEKGGS
jgi:hypothetical protein